MNDKTVVKVLWVLSGDKEDEKNLLTICNRVELPLVRAKADRYIYVDSIPPYKYFMNNIYFIVAIYPSCVEL